MSDLLGRESLMSLIRAVLKVGGGALVAKGVADDNQMEAIAAGLVALVAVIWGLMDRRTTKAQAQARDLKELSHLLMGLVLLAVLTGCASANAVWFRTEKLATDAAFGAVRTWNGFYGMESTNRTGARLLVLEERNAAVHRASREFAVSVMVVDGLRESVATNAAGTNRAALEVALAVMKDQSSNVVWLVRHFSQ